MISSNHSGYVIRSARDAGLAAYVLYKKFFETYGTKHYRMIENVDQLQQAYSEYGDGIAFRGSCRPLPQQSECDL